MFGLIGLTYSLALYINIVAYGSLFGVIQPTCTMHLSNLSNFTDLPERISLTHSTDAECGYLQYRPKTGDNLQVKFTAFCEEDNYYYACPGMYIWFCFRMLLVVQYNS